MEHAGPGSAAGRLGVHDHAGPASRLDAWGDRGGGHRAGNRRGVGATNHCAHGKDASIEELLDWRPYDYFTFRNTVPTPMGHIRFLATTEFEPTPSGTIIRMRMAAPQTRKERFLARLARPMLERGLRVSRDRLVEQLAVELELRGRDALDEPDLPPARTDGVLAPLESGS